MSPPSQERGLRHVSEGFHRADRCPEPSLPSSGAPQVGQWVKLQVNLTRPLECANYPNEAIDWFAMGGRVRRVLAATRVVADVVTTTDHAPADFGGDWVAELEHSPGLEFPWVLASLRPAKQSAPQVGVWDESSRTLLFKVACWGSDDVVERALRQIADVIFRNGSESSDVSADRAVADGFLGLSLPLPGGAGETQLSLHAVPRELRGVAACRELLLCAADGLITVLGGNEDQQDLERLAAWHCQHGRKVAPVWVVHAPRGAPDLPSACVVTDDASAFAALKLAAKGLLAKAGAPRQ